MLRERLDGWCERAILWLVLAVLVFSSLATGAVRPQDFAVVQGLTVGVVLLWLARVWLEPPRRFLWPPACWGVVGFVLYAVVRYAQADLEYIARHELIRVLVYAILFLALVNNTPRQEAVQQIGLVLMVLAMLISMYAVYQFATNSERVWHFVRPPQYAHRGSGTFICPNHFAGFVEMVLPLALSYVFLSRESPLTRILLGYAVLVMLAGIGVSLSRGGWLATGVSLVFFFALLIRKKQYRLPVWVCLALLAAGIGWVYARSASAQSRMDVLFQKDNPVESSNLRFHLAQAAVRMWLDHVWFGVGPGHFDARFPAYRPRMLQARPGYAHNDYVNTLADWGIVGGGILAITLGCVAAGVVKSRRFLETKFSDLGAKGSNRAAFVVGASAGVVALLVHCLFDFNLQIPADALVAVTLMALLTRHLRFATERHWHRLPIPGLVVVSLVMVAGAVYLTQQTARSVREQFWLRLAAREPANSPASLAALQRAATVEPTNADTRYSIGEVFRQRSWAGDRGYEPLAEEALTWFRRAMELNPYDPYNYLRIGMCLDWLGRHDEAAGYYEQSLKRDPNNYYLLAHQGWHLVQIGDYASAKPWFERSLELKWTGNRIALTYLGIVAEKLRESNPPARSR